MDLKSFREDKLKMSQSEFAALLGVETSNIPGWEKDPGSITWPVIQKILEVTGVKLEELTGWKKPILESLKVDNNWQKADFTKRTLIDYITTALANADISDEQRKAYINDLRKGVENKIVKPQVTMVGRSDTGKSTLINVLLGADKMPADWTPTTSIAVYIKHISDKPAFIEDDVWVFSNHVGDENLWNERRLNDEDYCCSWKIAAGGAEILKTFGIRQGENYNKNAGSAVMFLDAPILNVCDIVDLPGFGTTREYDDNIAFKAAQKADVIIYLSQANGFMRREDITYLKKNINELPIWEKKTENKLLPLSNLFIVASQAHTVEHGNRVSLGKIFDVGCSDLLKTLPDEYWANRQKVSGYDYIGYGKNELRSRFFTYTTDIPDLCSSFNDALKQVLEALPIIINDKAKEFVREYVKTRKPTLVNELQKYEELRDERDKYIALLDEIKSNELSRILDNDKRKKDVRDEIKRLKDESIKEFSEYFSRVINTDYLVKMMKDRGIKNKKDDVELFGSLLQSMLQERCESILIAKSERLSQKAKDYIAAYADSITRVFGNNAITLDFDAEWAFMSGLASAGIVGGLGAILAGLMPGAYATIFGVVGAGIGRFVAPLFGPLGIVIGLFLTGVLGFIKLFGGGWEKDVAKKIVKAFEENNFGGEFRESICNYWVQTEKEFDQAAATLDNEWENYVNNLQRTVEDYNINDIQCKITSLKRLSDFFDNIPL